MTFASDLTERAIQVAAMAHKGQKRKGTEIPYISHPFSVGLLLSQAGADEEIIAAGILHDTVEDTVLTIRDIESQFGQRIAGLVEGASEPDKSLPWKERKEHTIASLKTAALDVRMVVCADKLHNIRSIRKDLSEVGEDVWNRFNRGKKDQEWYYRSVVESLGFANSFELLDELRVEVDRVFGSQTSLTIPRGMEPEEFFDLLFEYRYGFYDDEQTEDEHGVFPVLRTIGQEVERIRRHDHHEMESMYQYLVKRGVEFETNSEGPEILLAFCIALERLFGLSEDEVWEHFRRNGRKRPL